MNFTDLVKRTNVYLAGETLLYQDIQIYLDSVIDDINEALHAKYPAFSELPAGTSEYTAFADKYQRTVLVFGVVTKYYAVDDEGYQNQNDYFARQYAQHMFVMTRDLTDSVPVEYQAPDTEGYLTGDPLLDEGVWLEAGELSNING